MRSHSVRLVLLALLATIALDLADADCIQGAWASEAACASSASDCACCVLSEVAAQNAYLQLPCLRTRSLPEPSGQTRAGVHPILYRPPLTLS
jgi:hypothetical protein